MSWLFFALLAPAVYAVVVFIDKYILEKEIADYRGLPIYSAIIALMFGTALWVAAGFPSLEFIDASLIIVTGIFTVWGLALYYSALSHSEVSKVTILFQMTPVITLVLSYLLLGDTISLKQFIGFLLIFISTIGVSLTLNKAAKKIRLSRVFVTILLTDFLWASAFVIFKLVIEANSFITVISYESWGIALGGLMLYLFFPSVRNAFHGTNKRIGRRVVILIAINEGIFLLSRLLTYLAISKGPVALVDVVGGTQVFFAIGYGLVLTLIAPTIFQEDITKQGLVKKVSMAVLVFLGLWCIS